MHLYAVIGGCPGCPGERDNPERLDVAISRHGMGEARYPSNLRSQAQVRRTWHENEGEGRTQGTSEK